MDKDLAVSFFKGIFSGKSLRIYLILLGLIFGSTIAGAIALFPGYAFFDFSISDLGVPLYNPSGWWLFSVAMWSQAVLVIPFFMHVRNIFTKYTPRLARLFRDAVFATSAGMGWLGFFPDAPPTRGWHFFAAGITFGGFLIDGCISWVTLIKMGHQSKEHRRKQMIFVLVPVMIIAFWGVLAAIGGSWMLVKLGLLDSASQWANLYFWEWCYLGAIGAYMLLLGIIISREPETS
nr:hypothetical protein [Candidatus Sigynarchaeota archaeon]